MHKPELLMIGLDGGMTSYVRDAIAEGRLPNFKRIMDNGVVCDNCMTAFPSITPTCWTTIATGAAPSVTNAIDHLIHIPGTELDETVNGYDPTYLRGERFWQAAGRLGKRALISGFPAMPAGKEGEGVYTLNAYGIESVSVVRRIFRINAFGTQVAGQTCKVAFRDGDGQWMPVNEAAGEGVALDNDTYRLFGIADITRQPTYRQFNQFSWLLRFEDGGVRVGENAETLCPPTKAGEWTTILTRKLSCADGSVWTLHFQGKVLSLDYAARSCELYIGAAKPVEDVAAPASYLDMVRDIPGNTSASPYQFILYDDKDNASYAEAYERCADWKLALIDRAMQTTPIDILFYYEGYIDTVNHIYRTEYENLPGTTPELHALAVDMYARAYDLADRTIGKLLERYADEQTTIVLVSDHGSVGYTARYQAYEHFIAEGLTVLDADGKVDWSKTVAYADPLTSGHAFVNLKGRDPHGIVEPSDYDKIVARMTDVLNRTSCNGMAFVLERQEADLVGQGGDSMCGDVIFGLRGSELGGYVGCVHAAQSPSAKSKTGDIRSLCVFKGPAFRKGLVLHRLMDETDIAPTVNFALGYPIPADATGGVILQALNTH